VRLDRRIFWTVASITIAVSLGACSGRSLPGLPAMSVSRPGTEWWCAEGRDGAFASRRSRTAKRFALRFPPSSAPWSAPVRRWCSASTSSFSLKARLTPFASATSPLAKPRGQRFWRGPWVGSLHAAWWWSPDMLHACLRSATFGAPSTRSAATIDAQEDSVASDVRRARTVPSGSRAPPSAPVYAPGRAGPARTTHTATTCSAATAPATNAAPGAQPTTNAAIRTSTCVSRAGACVREPRASVATTVTVATTVAAQIIDARPHARAITIVDLDAVGRQLAGDFRELRR
jgi:hypothetical protein